MGVFCESVDSLVLWMESQQIGLELVGVSRSYISLPLVPIQQSSYSAQNPV